MILTIIILLTVVIGIMAKVIYNLFNRNTQLELYVNELEGIVEKQTKESDDFDSYYEYLLELFTQCFMEMQRIDKRGSFSSDDEVGFSFKVIQKAIEVVTVKLREMRKEASNPEKK